MLLVESAGPVARRARLFPKITAGTVSTSATAFLPALIQLG
jgi:hypothetical protein